MAAVFSPSASQPISPPTFRVATSSEYQADAVLEADLVQHLAEVRRRRRVDHRLLVAGLVVPQLRHLLERLADALLAWLAAGALWTASRPDGTKGHGTARPCR
mgnify:CR=1 FL=1